MTREEKGSPPLSSPASNTDLTDGATRRFTSSPENKHAKLIFALLSSTRVHTYDGLRIMEMTEENAHICVAFFFPPSSPRGHIGSPNSSLWQARRNAVLKLAQPTATLDWHFLVGGSDPFATFSISFFRTLLVFADTCGEPRRPSGKDRVAPNALFKYLESHTCDVTVVFRCRSRKGQCRVFDWILGAYIRWR